MLPQIKRSNIFTQSLGDALSPKVLLVSLISALLTLLVFVIAIWLLFGGVGALSEWIAQSLQRFEGSVEDSWLLGAVSLVVVTKTLVSIIFIFTSAMVVYYLFLVVYSLIVGFFAGAFIKEIGAQYYQHIELRGMGLLSYGWLVAKTVILMIAMFFLLSPLLFVPMLNFVFLMPIFYLFHKLLVLDVASMLNTNEEYMMLRKKESGGMRSVSFVCFLLTLIPFLGVIAYPYYVIVMSHYLFRRTEALRGI